MNSGDGDSRHSHHAVRARRRILAANGVRDRMDECRRPVGCGLPGAYGRVNLFGTGPLLLATAGFLVIGLLKTPLRWSGSVAVVAAAIWAASTLRPDLLIAGDGRVRRTSKRISRSSTRCPATPAHSRESGNPELAVEFFEVLGPRLRGDERPGAGLQYRRNRPTSLPWMRTRLGGRIRTS